MKQVKCQSGLKGWQSRLRPVYSSFDEFFAYCDCYGIHSRLGYDSPESAWDANPVVQGSVDPSDYRKVSV